MTRSKRERERDHYAKEARIAFGQTARVGEPVGLPEAQPVGPALDEARRAAAVHDPAQPSACRLCGQTTAPGGAEVSGWKCCGPCAALLPGGLAAVLSELVGEAMTKAEAVAVLERIPADNPAYFLGRWATDRGQPWRWTHVAPDFAERGRSALSEVRASVALRRASSGRGCMACGVARSTSWSRAPWRWGTGRDAPHGSICGDCLGWVRRSGAYSGYAFRTHLLAAAVGMRRPQMGVDYGLKAFFESGAAPAGTAEPWQYLGETRAKLRAKVVRAYPRLVTLTNKERRVLDMEAAVAEAEHPPQRAPLANVD